MSGGRVEYYRFICGDCRQGMGIIKLPRFYVDKDKILKEFWVQLQHECTKGKDNGNKFTGRHLQPHQ